MRVNYVPPQRKILRDVFGGEPPPVEYPPETWAVYGADHPIISNGDRTATLAKFPFLPKGRNARKLDTANARSETVGQLRTFGGPWQSGQLCVIPMHSFFEPNYEARPKSGPTGWSRSPC